MGSFSLGEIPVEETRGWKHFIWLDGVKKPLEEVLGRKVGKAEWLNEKIGLRLIYGKHPKFPYDTVSIEEGYYDDDKPHKGGGSVTMLYSFDSRGELLVGLRLEDRPNMNSEGKTLCAIGGFLDFGESHDKAQSRELEEETGIKAVAELLPGLPSNFNRAIVNADCVLGQGVVYYCYWVDYEALSQKEQAKVPDRWEEAECLYGFIDPEAIGFKKAADVRFVPWFLTGCNTNDMLARDGAQALQSALRTGFIKASKDA